MEIGFYLFGFSGYTWTVTVNTSAGVTVILTNPYP